jgi:hypothetical protein
MIRASMCATLLGATVLPQRGEPYELLVSLADESFKGDNVAFAAMLGATQPARLDYRFTIYAGENHNDRL